MNKILLTILVLLFLLPLQPTSTLALSCVEILNVEGGYARFDGVVIGQVDKVSRRGEYNKVQITVSKSFKGVDVNKITLVENSTWGATMGPSVVGTEYLYFLQQKDGQWENQLCSPTVKLSDASDMLEYLKDKEIPITQVEDNSTHWSVYAIGIVFLLGIILFLLIRIRK